MSRAALGALLAAMPLAPGCRPPPEPPPVPARAPVLLAERCDRGDGPACVEVAALHREAGDPARAAAYARRACDLASAHGCADLARAFEQGEGVTANPAGAIELYVGACLGGHAGACRAAAAGLGEPDAAEFRRRGCLAGDQALCPPIPEPPPPRIDPRDEAQVVMALAERRAEIGACYRRALAERPGLRGRVILEIAVGAEGRARAAAVLENIRAAPAVGACVAEVALRAGYAPTTTGEIVIVPWRVVFEPEP